jgi:hypothetical protein
MLLPAALIVVVTGCSSIPTANIHPARPVGDNNFEFQVDLFFAYDPSKMITETDFTGFKDLYPSYAYSGQYGITDRTCIGAMFNFLPPLGFETNIKQCIVARDNRWFSLELGAGANLKSYYDNYYFYTGALYEYHLPCDLGFNVRLSGYCANVNVDGFHRLFFPQLGLSIILPDWGGGRISLNGDIIVWNNPINDEWYPGYSFGISGYGPLTFENLFP